MNNGLMTKIWGPAGWTFLHCITYGYPTEPTDERREKFKQFFTLVGEVLPCKYCRDSYKEFINDKMTELNDDVLTNRRTLTEWLYNIHNAVNYKLGMDYGDTLEDIDKRYESYRAQCLPEKHTCEVPEDYRARSFKIANIKHCPLVSRELANKIIPYALARGISKSEFHLLNEYCEKTNDEIWNKRNKECCEIINGMRENSIPSLETTGSFIGLPTIDETRLLLRMSSNLSKKELIKMFDQLEKLYPNIRQRKWRMIK